jgi:hypothetical protein
MVYIQKLGPLYDATSWNSVLKLRSRSLKMYLVHTTWHHIPQPLVHPQLTAHLRKIQNFITAISK